MITMAAMAAVVVVRVTAMVGSALIRMVSVAVNRAWSLMVRVRVHPPIVYPPRVYRSRSPTQRQG